MAPDIILGMEPLLIYFGNVKQCPNWEFKESFRNSFSSPHSFFRFGFLHLGQGLDSRAGAMTTVIKLQGIEVSGKDGQFTPR